MANNKKATLTNLQYEIVYRMYTAIWELKPAAT